MEDYVEVEYEGKKVKVYFRSITYGERNDLIRKFSVVDVQRGMKVEIKDPIGMMEELIVMSIDHVEPEGAMPITIDAIRKLSKKDGEAIEARVAEINPL